MAGPPGMRQYVAPRAHSFNYNRNMDNLIFSPRTGHSQLRRLVALRGVAVAAQLITLIAVFKILELNLNWQPMLQAITALALINLLTMLRLRSSKPVSNLELFTQLCVDVIVLSVLLYFGGGSTNPFVSLYLMPLVITATTLSRRYTWSMAALTISCYSLLMIYFVPLPHNHMLHNADNAFNTHVLGMWLGFIISACLIAYFVVQMAQAVRRRDELLARIREEILRNEHIVALGTQAASAAHEMGTPLATMAVVINELQHDMTDQAEQHASLSILNDQVGACKRILDKILADSGDSATVQNMNHFIADILDEWQLLRPTAQYHYHPSNNTPIPYIKSDITLRAALMNLLNNAADAATVPIEIHAAWDAEHYTLSIHDQGPGLNNEVARKAGAAFFTTKNEGRGLGLYLANATIERMGGAIRLFNRAQGGATTEIMLPISWERA